MRIYRNAAPTVLMLVLLASIYFNAHKCTGGAEQELHRDTIRTVCVDTVKCFTPVPKDSAVVRYITVKLPVVTAERDTSFAPDIYVGSKTDSADVVIPISQKVYEDSLYTAYVSGYNPSLDSIAIRAAREVVTVKEFRKPKRWSIGVFAGYGITPKGFQPCIGVGISYTLRL